MNAATVIPPRPPSPRGGSSVLGHSPRRPRPGRPPGPFTLHGLGLGLVLVLALGLRLWGVRQGLPYSYNIDEASHFVPRAIAFFSHDLNPRYFLNPPAYSYLVHSLLELWYGSGDAVARQFARDPSGVYVLARVAAAICGTLAVALTYVAGRRLFSRTAGLLAAGILGIAFLPVFYSHLALNDAPTLLPVALALIGIAGVASGRGAWRDYALAGLGVGLAAATKYTGGYTLLCLLLACAVRLRAGHGREALRGAALGLLVALVSFTLANPYAVLAPSEFLAGVSAQASQAGGADPVKLGATVGSGLLYYVWTFTWGLGWGPALAALGGAVLLGVRRRFALLLVLVPAPVVFLLFMGSQQRFFGRWLMPLFPLTALLAGWAGVEAARALSGRLRVPPVAAGTLVALLLLTQGLVADIHDDGVLARPDTRNLTRAWMVENVPAGAKVVIEPVVPDSWASDIGTSLPWTNTGERWWRYATWFSHLDQRGHPLAPGQVRYVPVDEYERTLNPSLITGYEQTGYCWVVVGSLQAGRAFADPRAAPGAVAYYAALTAQARLVYHVTPFAPGARPVPFSFDWSIDYLPRQYRRPGPEISVYRLSGGRCA